MIYACRRVHAFPPCRCRQCVRHGTTRRLEWQYGRERALNMEAGNDPAYESDREAWSNLGR